MSEKRPEDSNLYQRVASGIASFLAFCCIVNGVYGYGWTQHVIIKHHGDQSRDVIVVEEGIWLARACDMNGHNCYMSTKQSVLEYAGMSESKAVFGGVHEVLSTVSVIASTLCVVFTIYDVVAKHSNLKCRIRSVVIAVSISLVADVSLVCLFCTVPTRIVSRAASSWAFILTFVGSCLEFCVTLFVFYYVINILRHHYHRRQCDVRSVPRNHISPILSSRSHVISPPDYATLYPDVNQQTNDKINVSFITSHPFTNDNKTIQQNKQVRCIKAERTQNTNVDLAV